MQYLIYQSYFHMLGELYPLYDGNNIIGTVISRCDITINDKSISDVHAVIKIDRNTIFITDLR